MRNHHGRKVLVRIVLDFQLGDLRNELIVSGLGRPTLETHLRFLPVKDHRTRVEQPQRFFAGGREGVFTVSLLHVGIGGIHRSKYLVGAFVVKVTVRVPRRQLGVSFEWAHVYRTNYLARLALFARYPKQINSLRLRLMQ